MAGNREPTAQTKASDRTCAYCDKGTDLTCEHIIPDSYHQSVGESISIVLTKDGDKAIPKAQEVRDVCGTCNSGPLSRLDTYFADLTKEYLSQIIHKGDCVRFKYDFGRLSRFILKIAYNVARTRNNWSLGVLRTFRDYILGTEKACPSGLRVFLQLLTPTPANETKLPLTPGTKEVPPLPWHAEIFDVSIFPGLVFACSVSFMSYRFFIVQEDMNVSSRIRQRSISRWLKANKGIYELSRKGNATIYASPVKVLNVLENDPNFREHLQKARKLKSEMEGKR